MPQVQNYVQLWASHFKICIIWRAADNVRGLENIVYEESLKELGYFNLEKEAIKEVRDNSLPECKKLLREQWTFFLQVYRR